MSFQRDLGHFRNQPADCKTIRADCEIGSGENVFKLHSVYDWKDPLKQGFRYFEPDKIVVLLRCITILGNLHHVEPKLYFQMGSLVLRIFD
jgi:hypothetical protein